MQSPETITGFATYVLNELSSRGVEQFHLVGHSMGGMIAQEMVFREPNRVDQLVLYGTGPVGAMPGRFETIDESRNRVTDEGAELTGRRISASWFLHGEKAAGYEVCSRLAIRATVQAALAGLKAMEAWSGVASLSKIDSRTLILWGDKDKAYRWNQPEQLWREITHASLAVIPGCSHAVHLEKPHLFNAMLLDFLDAQ